MNNGLERDQGSGIGELEREIVVLGEVRSLIQKGRQIPYSGLWRHPDFMKLWIGQTISEFGTWLGALSLLAILVLDASPAQMGLLEMLRSAPTLFLSLFAGVWVDRVRRRPLLILADLGRGVLLGLVVLLSFLGSLQMEFLHAVALGVGGLTVLFGVAYRAFVPSLVQRRELVEANSKLGATSALAEIASPGLGGILVQLMSAPLTLLLDAASYFLSAGFLASIRTPEPAPVQRDVKQSVLEDVREGLRTLLVHPLLRPIAAASATRGFFGGFFAALYSLFVLRDVGLSPALLGILIGSGGIGSLLGALLTGRVTGQFGWGRSIIGSSLLAGLFALLIPLAGGPRWLALTMLLINQVVGDVFLTIYFVSSLTLLQALTPDGVLGRVNASNEFLVGGVSTAGILLGGLIGELVGLRPATAVAAAGIVAASLWLIFSPLRRLTGLEEWRVQNQS